MGACGNNKDDDLRAGSRKVDLDKPEIKAKVIVVGPMKVGKTTMIQTLMNGKFDN